MKENTSFEAILTGLDLGDFQAGMPEFQPPPSASFLWMEESLDSFNATGFAEYLATAGLDEFAPSLAPSGDSEAEVERELALSSLQTVGALRSARRRFMWENHPDRRQDLPVDIANRRVAIANMLIDEALRTRYAGAAA